MNATAKPKLALRQTVSEARLFYHIHGWSVAEIAAAMGTSRANVYRLLRGAEGRRTRRFRPSPIRRVSSRYWEAEVETLHRLYEQENLTMQAIADRYDVSRERIRQVLNEHGIGKPGARQKRAGAIRHQRYLQRVEAAADEIMRRWRQGETVAEVASALKLDAAEVGRIVREHASELELRRRERAKVLPPRMTDEEMLDALRTASGGAYLTAKEFTAWALANGCVTHQTYLQRFGSWTNACSLAGLPEPPKRPPRKFRVDRISDARIKFEIAQVIAALGHLPTALEYERFAQEHGYASLSTVRNRFGQSWVAALEAVTGE